MASNFHRSEPKVVREHMKKFNRPPAFKFIPPVGEPESALTILKDRGAVCRHGRFRFESCKSCGRNEN